MNAMQLCNEPVAFKVGGQVLHFRRLSALRLAAVRQAAFQASLYDGLRIAIDAMPEAEKAEARADKVLELRDARPHGFAFVSSAQDHLVSEAEMNKLMAEACTDGLDVDAVGRALNGTSRGEQCAIIEHVFNSKRAQFWSDGEIRNIVKFMAEKYGYTPQEISALSDDQIFDLIPGLAEAEAKKLGEKAKAEALKKEPIGNG